MYSQKEVDYKPSSAPLCHRCGICTYYVRDPRVIVPETQGVGSCAIVEGAISPMYGCKEFNKDLIVAANDPLDGACNE